MKRTILSTLIIGVAAMCMAVAAQAADMKHSGHGNMTGNAQDGMKGHDSMSGGMKIHTSMVDGYHLSYELIDMSEKMASMKTSEHMKKMPEMTNTHHLMVFVTSPDGELVESATVGYLVKGPGEETQKAMAMGMLKGFGADVNFSQKGDYTIVTKVKAGEAILKDTFVHSVN